MSSNNRLKSLNHRRNSSVVSSTMISNVVSLDDDLSSTTLSIRVFLLGFILGCTGAAVGQIFFFKSNGIGFNNFLIILVSYPMGKTLERLLPNWTISFGRWRLRLNPGPFTLKEHLLIGVLASGASGSSYAGDIVAVQDLYYHQDIGHIGGLLLILSTQLIGFGLSGLTYWLLVRPTNMIWPSSLVVMTMYNTLHHRRRFFRSDYLIDHRFNFFLIVFVAITIYQFLPTVFAPTLSSIAVLCLINNRSQFMRVLGSAYTGAGMFSLSFDWAVITSISLQTPFYSSFNYFAGLIWSMWIVVPTLWYFDVWNYQSFGDNAVSSKLFDSNFKKYNVSAVVKPDLTLDLKKYEEMGPIQLTPYFAMYYGIGFAVLTSAITTVVLFHSEDVRLALASR
ncbi:OPT oligopeptide transporter protein-domain-containing protein, partial [Phakopsora pachyrhizi]